jgi:hypothetical protein
VFKSTKEFHAARHRKILNWECWVLNSISFQLSSFSIFLPWSRSRSHIPAKRDATDWTLSSIVHSRPHSPASCA